MKFRPIHLHCECGCEAEGLHSVGFTSEYELVVHWTCSACGKLAYFVKTLSDCCKEVPEEADTSESDAFFLLSLGIRP
jgi:hypothetical protein